MKSRRALVIRTLLISPSGALSPGPLSAAAVAIGPALGLLGGLIVAAGHMTFELPYVIFLVKTTAKVKNVLKKKVGRALMSVMALFTAFFAAGLAELALRGGDLRVNTSIVPMASSPLGALTIGIVYTGLNPYFLAWWATAGFPLIEEASETFNGLTTMYLAHVWMDFAWLGLLAAGGGAVAALGSLPYRLLLALLSAVLAYYAIVFVFKAFQGV